MNLNRIRKSFFTNIFAERIFILCLRTKIIPKFIVKLLPINRLYSNNTIRNIKRNGIRYKLDISDYQAWLLYFLSDNDSSFHILRYLGESQVIIDIGGNIGQTSLVINANRVECVNNFKIICFEPYPENFNKLLTNINLNSNIQNIKLENIGLGDKNSQVEMFKECISNSGGNRIVYDPAKNTEGIEVVQITTLDNYLESNNIEKVDFVKIDVEGFEYSVLKGAIKTLRKSKPKLYIELDNANLKKQGSSSVEMISLLKRFGYSIKDVQNRYTESELKMDKIHTDIFCE